MAGYKVISASAIVDPGASSAPPANVTSLLATHQGWTPPDANGKRNAIIHVTYVPPSGWTGKGVHLYVEAPDGSGSNPRARLGAFSLGTSALNPEFTPFDAGKFPYDATNQTPAIVELDAPTFNENWRVYAASYNSEFDNPVLPATEAGAPPSTLVSVTPPTAYISGEEWAKNVSGLTAFVDPGVSEAGDDIWRLVAAWQNPTDPRLFGIEMVIRPDGTSGDKDSVPSGVLAAGTTNWVSDWWPIGADLRFTLFARSVSRTNNAAGDSLRNTIVIGVTPRVTGLFAGAAIGGSGSERAPLVTGFTANIEPGVTEAGDEGYRVQGSWTLPTNRDKFRGVKVVARPAGTTGSNDIILAVETDGATTFRTDLFPTPAGSNTLTIYTVSIDANNRANTITSDTPKVVVTVTRQGNGAPGSGEEVAPNVSSFTVTVLDGGVDEVGGQRYRLTGSWVNPGDPTRFRGVKIVMRPFGGTGSTDIVLAIETEGSTSFRTDPFPVPSSPESYTIYAVSIDANNRANSITGGAPQQGVTISAGPGQLKLNRAAAASFNTAEFETVGGSTFQAVEFSAQKIFVGSILRVGGGSGAQAPSFKGSNGQIAVYNASNVLRAWMGQNGVVYGGWFGELYIGGSGPGSAPLYSTNAGVVVIGGPVGGTGYITLRNNFDVEVGRIGANIDFSFHGAWFKQLRVGGPNISSPVIQSDASGNTTITNASLTVSNGSKTVLINPTDSLKVTNTTLSSFAQIEGSQCRIEHATDNLRFCQITLGALQIQSAFGASRVVVDINGLIINFLRVVGARKTGWAEPTGAAYRGAWDAASVSLPTLAQAVKALISDLHGNSGHGLIGS